MKFKDLDLYSNEELALCVWAGFLGDSYARKQKLGNRYSAVQAIVNKQASTQLIEPIQKSTPMIGALKKAVKETYDEAADELIEAIVKEMSNGDNR